MADARPFGANRSDYRCAAHLVCNRSEQDPALAYRFIQYISPTISLLSGVLVLGEPFTSAHAVCFACIWAGAVLVIVDAIRKQVSQR